MQLEVQGLSASIGVMRILHDIDLHLNEGETVCLIGANGAGKSTLMRSISGLLRPVRGAIRFAGQNVVALPAEKIVRKGISLVPEGRQIFSPLTVRENLLMGAFSRREHDAELAFVLNLFPKLESRLAQVAGTLSGGEQQMLAIGRALMSRPRLLLLDEPSLGLAPKIVAEIFETIEQLGRQGTTVLLAEQNAGMAFKVASRGYVLSEGRCVLSGSTDELVGNDMVKKAYLGV